MQSSVYLHHQEEAANESPVERVLERSTSRKNHPKYNVGRGSRPDDRGGVVVVFVRRSSRKLPPTIMKRHRWPHELQKMWKTYVQPFITDHLLI